jgi:hypothetical protein
MSPSGSLRRAATDLGIAAVTLETGGPGLFEERAVASGVEAIEALLNHLEMQKRFRPFGEPQPVFYESMWVRAESGGILLSNVRLGAIVSEGQLLGTVTDPIGNKREYLVAPLRGRILGMAVNQVVMPGFAAFHIGRVASEALAIESTTGEAEPADSEHTETTDELDPEQALLIQTVPVANPSPGDDSYFPEFNWLPAPVEPEQRGCVRPPLAECQ